MYVIQRICLEALCLHFFWVRLAMPSSVADIINLIGISEYSNGFYKTISSCCQF